LAQHIRNQGKRDAQYAPSFPEAVASAVSAARYGDLILTLGAGSVSQLAPLVLEQLSHT
jgi:UDP-N-acetylmuramate--alanine ligase